MKYLVYVMYLIIYTSICAYIAVHSFPDYEPFSIMGFAAASHIIGGWSWAVAGGQSDND